MHATPRLSAGRPDLAAQLVEPSLGEVLPLFSSRSVDWRCSRGHTWSAPVHWRTKNGHGCPYCAGQRVLPGFNDLATTHPHLAAELVDGSVGLEVSAGSSRRAWWTCAKGHAWETTVKARSRGSGCLYCSRQRALPGETDLGTTHPAIAAQLVDPHQASQVTAGSTARKLLWRCTLGHTWEASPATRTRVGARGCPACQGRRVEPGFNDLATTHPSLASALLDPRQATTVTAGSKTRLSWTCGCGNVWVSPVKSRALAGHGCPACAKRGFNTGMPTTLYWVRNSTTGLNKVGVSNTTALPARLAVHARKGMTEVVATRPFENGTAALRAEAALVLCIQESRPQRPVTRDELCDGYTEAFWHDDAIVTALAAWFATVSVNK